MYFIAKACSAFRPTCGEDGGSDAILESSCERSDRVYEVTYETQPSWQGCLLSDERIPILQHSILSMDASTGIQSLERSVLADGESRERDNLIVDYCNL